MNMLLHMKILVWTNLNKIRLIMRNAIHPKNISLKVKKNKRQQPTALKKKDQSTK